MPWSPQVTSLEEPEPGSTETGARERAASMLRHVTYPLPTTNYDLLIRTASDYAAIEFKRTPHISGSFLFGIMGPFISRSEEITEFQPTLDEALWLLHGTEQPSELESRLARVNDHFRQRTSEAMADLPAIELLADIARGKRSELTDLQSGHECLAFSAALARLTAANLCRLAGTRVFPTQQGRALLEKLTNTVSK